MCNSCVGNGLLSNAIVCAKLPSSLTIIFLSIRKGVKCAVATKQTVSVVWMESRQQWLAKSTEYYNGKAFKVVGYSRLGKTEARKAWKRNYDKKIASMEARDACRNCKVRFDEAIQEWYKQYKLVDGRKPETVRTDTDTIKHLVEEFGSTLVCDLDSDTIQRYINRLAAEKSNSLVRKRWNMLHMFLDYAFPGNNPMARCNRTPSRKMARAWKVETGDEDEPTDKLAYSADEMARLAAELSKPYNVHSKWGSADRGYSAGSALIVCMYEFLRVGEVVELRVKDVQWNGPQNGNYIWVRRQYDENHKIVGLPKYGSKRKIPIMRECEEILRNACEGKKPGDLLFPSGIIYNPDKVTHEGRLLRGRLRSNLNLACERAGLDRHTIHDLRHDGISRLVELGVQPASVKKWAGHKSLTVTLDRYYRHTSMENEKDLALVSGKREAAQGEALGAACGDLCGGGAPGSRGLPGPIHLTLASSDIGLLLDAESNSNLWMQLAAAMKLEGGII